jgi:hypothetical protein
MFPLERSNLRYSHERAIRTYIRFVFTQRRAALQWLEHHAETRQTQERHSPAGRMCHGSRRPQLAGSAISFHSSSTTQPGEL